MHLSPQTAIEITCILMEKGVGDGDKDRRCRLGVAQASVDDDKTNAGIRSIYYTVEHELKALSISQLASGGFSAIISYNL